MGQSSYVYILWIVILVAGLWIIIGFGSTTLHAREDLAGEWELTPERPSAGQDLQKMRVEQSGRFFKVTLPEGKSLNMTMIEETVVDQHFGEHKRIILAGQRATVTFEGLTHGDLWRFLLEGSPADGTRGGYVARLVDRTYPRPAPATRPARQTTP
jgi:hypothetical protein